jgi:serine/threonine protein phosphatase PrpC
MITSGTLQGPRPYQEDRYYSCESISGFAIMMVADGHGGSRCSEYIHHYFELMNIFPENFNFLKNLAYQTSEFTDGSTLSTVLVSKNKADIAIIGDSPVIVIDDKGDIHYSPDHNVRTNQKEAKAVEDRGGFVYGGYASKYFSGPGLQMGRALGDRELQPVVISEPEIYSIPNPAIILVATDGLFDPSHQNDDVRKQIISSLTGEGTPIAKDLLTITENNGLQDNATAIVWRKE